MGSDDLFKKRKGNRKRRKKNIRERVPYRYLIVCEGKKTEPNYFEGIKRHLNQKYNDTVEVKTPIELDIQGTGRNTEDLVNFAKKQRSFSKIPYGHVWVVFDRDDFTVQQFSNAIANARKSDMGVAWSNEAIELWFLLHFEYLDASIHRYQYIDKLNDYFREYGVNKGKYEKNLGDIYDILSEYGDTNEAIQNAEKLRKFYEEQGINNEYNMNPGTTVDELVQELLGYL